MTIVRALSLVHNFIALSYSVTSPMEHAKAQTRDQHATAHIYCGESERNWLSAQCTTVAIKVAKEEQLMYTFTHFQVIHS